MVAKVYFVFLLSLTVLLFLLNGSMVFCDVVNGSKELDKKLSFESIKQTAQTLKEKKFEVSITNLSYGITDSLMLSSSFLSLLGFHSDLMVTKKFEITENQIMSPKFGLEYWGDYVRIRSELWTSYHYELFVFSFGLESTWGLDKTIGHYNRLDVSLGWSANIDWYVRKHSLVYLGVVNRAYYLGYSWRLRELLSIGFVWIGHSLPGIILPSVYLRF